jgi:hypothetical protein
MACWPFRDDAASKPENNLVVLWFAFGAPGRRPALRFDYSRKDETKHSRVKTNASRLRQSALLIPLTKSTTAPLCHL